MNRGWLPCLVLVAACGSKKEDKPLPQTSPDLPAEAPVDAAPLAIDPSAPPAGPPKPPPDPMAQPIMPAPPPRAGNCLVESETMAVSVDGDELLACVDADQDGSLDRCAKWNRTIGIQRGFEDTDEEIAHKPISFDDDDDDRIDMVDDPQIEVCPPDRLCVKLMPKVPEDGEITGVGADPTYRYLGVGISDEDGRGHVELWDLVAGRLRTKLKLRKLEEDVSYSFNARFVGNALLAVASRDDNDMGQGVIFGPDGSFRGELANGSRFLDMTSMFELVPGTIAMLDLEAPGVPYVVYTQSLSGRVQKKFVVQMDMDGDDDDAHLHKVSPTMLAVSQWSTELRLDVIDLSTGKLMTYRVPAC